MNTASALAAPTEADVALSDTIRRICGTTLYNGDWPREAMNTAIGLTVAMDVAESRGEQAKRVASGLRLLALAKDSVPHIAETIAPTPLAKAA